MWWWSVLSVSSLRTYIFWPAFTCTPADASSKLYTPKNSSNLLELRISILVALPVSTLITRLFTLITPLLTSYLLTYGARITHVLELDDGRNTLYTICWSSGMWWRFPSISESTIREVSIPTTCSYDYDLDNLRTECSFRCMLWFLLRDRHTVSKITKHLKFAGISLLKNYERGFDPPWKADLTTPSTSLQCYNIETQE